MTQSEKIGEYIQEKERYTIIGTLDSIKSEFDALVGKEKKETGDGLKLFEWLKNDKNLLTYAELKNKEESELSGGDKLKMNLLELKLSITCPYFSDFKVFLEELKKGDYVPKSSAGASTEDITATQSDTQGGSDMTSQVDEYTENIHQGYEFCNVPIGEIHSYPYYKNSKTGVTWCSTTAQMNGQNFGLNLPHGDAYNAGAKPGKDVLYTLPKNKINKKPSKQWPSLTASEFQSVKDDSNFADIYVESKSNYGHRAVAFRDVSGQWYVLDPYIRVKGILDDSPKKLEDYLSAKKIVKSHFYKSNGYTDKELAYK